jgi:hypothetical protein
MFTLELKNVPANCPIHAEGYGMHGERAFSADLTAENKNILSLSALPSGIYLIRVIAEEKAQTIKIIKQ